MYVSLRPLSTRPAAQRYASLCSKASVCPSALTILAPHQLRPAARSGAHAAAAPQAAMSTTQYPRSKHFWTTKVARSSVK